MRYDRNEYKLHGYTRGQLNTRHKTQWKRETNWPLGRVVKWAGAVLALAILFSTASEVITHVNAILKTVPSKLQLTVNSSGVRG